MGNNNTRVTRDPLVSTGLEETNPGKLRYVRVLKTSYLNGALLEPGQVTVWPRGVEKLGNNLEEYDPATGAAVLKEPEVPAFSKTETTEILGTV